MIANVLPMIRLPAHLDCFDYEVQQELCADLRVGQMVRIPFRKKIISGIVIDIREKTDAVSLKSIIALCGTDPILTPLQKEILSWFSDFYVVSRATVCRMMFLQPRARKKKAEHEKQQEAYPHLPSPAIRLSAASISALSAAMKRIEQAKKPILLHCANEHEKIALYAKCSRMADEQKKQILIICPTISEISYLAARLAPYLPSPPLAVHSGLRISELRQSLEYIQSGRAYIILGTRMALFHAIPHLHTIIIDQSERQEHKQYDMHPRYHISTVASALAKKFPLTTILQSHAPRLEDAYTAHQGAYDFVSLDTPHPATQLIHLTQEEYIPSAPLISETLKEKISYQLSKKKHTFLFLNKKGLSSSVVCQTCSTPFTCPSCKRERAYFAKTRILSCVFCKTHDELPHACPVCKGSAFLFPGAGSEKIVSSIKKMFPGIPVVEINKETSSVIPSPPSIIIGTSFVPLSHPELFSSFGLVCILRADPTDSLSDFRSQEIQWQTLSRTLMLANAEQCEILIHAFKKDHPFVSTLYRLDWTSFSDAQLAQRKECGWPPYTRLIALSYRPQKNANVNAIRTVYETLSRTLGTEIRVSLLSKRAFREQERILITYPASYLPCDPLIQTISCELKHLPSGFLVDIDPYMM